MGARGRKDRRREPARPPAPEHGARVVAIVGSHTFLGAALAARLREDPAVTRVVAIDVRPPVDSHSRVGFRRVDISRPSAELELADVLHGERVDTVVHVAFLGGPISDVAFAHELEAIGTLNVLTASASARVERLLVQSTTGVYGAHPRNPALMLEDQPLRAPEGFRFLQDRLEAEREVARFAREHPHTRVIVLRLASILGPSVKNVVTRYLRAGLTPTWLGYDPLVQAVHESDAVEAFARALTADAHGPFNIVGSGVLPLSTAIRLAGSTPLPLPRLLTRPGLSALAALGLSPAPAAVLDFLRYPFVADGDRARRELAFLPRYSTREAVLSLSGGA